MNPLLVARPFRFSVCPASTTSHLFSVWWQSPPRPFPNCSLSSCSNHLTSFTINLCLCASVWCQVSDAVLPCCVNIFIWLGWGGGGGLVMVLKTNSEYNSGPLPYPLALRCNYWSWAVPLRFSVLWCIGHRNSIRILFVSLLIFLGNLHVCCESHLLVKNFLALIDSFNLT